MLPALGRKPQPVKYATQAARRGNLVVVVSATGTLEPLKKVDVGIEVSGTIKTVEADYNDQVKVGQVLARLDTSRLEAQAQQNEAALAGGPAKVVQAQASVEEARGATGAAQPGEGTERGQDAFAERSRYGQGKPGAVQGG